MRHPRYTDIRVKSLRGLSGLTCTISPIANNVFTVEDCQHLLIDCSNSLGKNRVILSKNHLLNRILWLYRLSAEIIWAEMVM